MTLEWTVRMTVEFPEYELEDICQYVRENGWDERKVYSLIFDVAMCFDDEDYYNWGPDQTVAVMNEIKRRVGGVQLSMFDEERA